MSDTKRSSGHRFLGSFIGVAICVLVAVFLLVNRQHVVDQVSVWQYTPSSEVASFAERSGMGNKGTFYFYTGHPSLETAAAFNKKCTRKEESTAILGCYNGQYIYIYNVTDAKLDGIREVTAAHEMLHAAYSRLSDSEKQTINGLLEAEYAKLKGDPKLADRMAFYARTEPGERGNELHSVIGTEIAKINPELEAHYKNYFTDRSKVIALHAKYASVFADLQSRGTSLSAQLTQLGDQIEQESLDYNTDVNLLSSDIKSFNDRATNGDFSSQTEFQNERAALENRANQLDERRQAINDKIAQYEALRQELTSVSSQSEALNQSIDSSLAPAPSL